ncbi:MAG: lipopolysaccharide heptosyltransferase family protein [Deltaproteobacteria bacterium]|nr:MAG: lipopolysaccharide heptosyltransferase family protein [Deltaproteobacteria bacterium]
MLKKLEQLGKYLLALVAAPLLWRPWRRRNAEARLRAAGRILLVRIDDRVGEVLLLTPLLATLRTRARPPTVHVLVHPRAARILEGHPAADAVIPFDRRGLWRGPWCPAFRQLREAQYDVVVDCGNWSVPSVTHALVARLAGPHAAVVGPAVWPTGALHTHPVPPRADTRREVLQRVHLLSPLDGLSPVYQMSVAPRPADPALEALLEAVRETPHAVVNPGGRLGYRRVPPEVFAAAARALLRAGRRPVVTWGPGEEGLARFVAEAAPGALLAPATTLDDLAALFAAAGLTVCNNTGPMHLSVAVGAPTLQLFLHMDPVRWGHPDPPHRVLDLTPVAASPEEMCARVEAAIPAFVRAVAHDRAGPGPRHGRRS